MKLGELLEEFRENNITVKRHGKRHDIYYSPLTNKSFSVPRHASEIKTGTLHSIRKDAGLE